MKTTVGRRLGQSTTLLALLLGLAACGTDSPADRENTAPAETEAVDATPDAIVQARTLFSQDFAGAYAAYLDAQLAPSAMRYLLLDAERPVRVRRPEFLATLYEARQWQPVFLDGNGPNWRTSVLLQQLEGARAHAMDPAPYLPDTLRTDIEDARQLAGALRVQLTPTLTTAESAALLALLDDPTISAAADPAMAALARALDEEAGAEPFASVRRVHAQRVQVEQLGRGVVALAEAQLADALLAWAFDMRLFNVGSLTNLTESEQHQRIADNMRATFEAWATATTPEAAQQVLDALQPAQPQYGLLMASRARYAQIVADGGWQEVRPTSLRRGSSGERVRELKRRLQIEGYYDGEIDDRFDAALEAAVRVYQETHQLEVNGESSRPFWNSLNISAQERLAQIELTMQRWRESRIGDDPYYVFVNIPDFHTEVWRDGVRQTRFRIVVGNTQRECDRRTGQWRYPNATPIQSAMMSFLVLNPYWNLPTRIVQEEVLPALIRNPNYFEENGMEQVDLGSGMRVRQRPGPRNPLGRVKFMFPNPHDTYLHDTSRPQYFQYPIRAFSHGCMRVQNPLDFLELLLTNDGQWDERQINRVLGTDVETTIRFREPVPVHIEYYVVRVDDEGRTHFLADIYRLDRDRMNPPDSSTLRCDAPPAPTHRLVLGQDGRPMVRDAEGNLLAPEEVNAAQRARDANDPAAGDLGP